MADGVDNVEITDATKKFFEQEFKKLDDGDGYLTSDELADCLELFGLRFEDEQIDQIREMFAGRGKGHRLRINDVLNKLPEVVKHSMSGDDMIKAFRVFDTDNDGYIRLPEMKKILCSGPNGMEGDTAAKIITALMKFDTNHDGKFDYTEFINMYTSDEYRLIQAKAEEETEEEANEEEEKPGPASSAYASLYAKKYTKSPAKSAPKSAKSSTKTSPPSNSKSARASARLSPNKSATSSKQTVPKSPSASKLTIPKSASTSKLGATKSASHSRAKSAKPIKQKEK